MTTLLLLHHAVTQSKKIHRQSVYVCTRVKHERAYVDYTRNTLYASGKYLYYFFTIMYL